MFALLSRVWTALSPPSVEKKDGAIRFGVLGAAMTLGASLLVPAKSHPEVIVQAISARTRSKAEDIAKKNGIPEIKSSYQDIIDDPNIDAVYIPLPNSLHLEWAVRAIQAGKHVLLEKPSVSNTTEANLLFGLPELSQPNAPVLLEALHNNFHPSLKLFLSFIDPAHVEHISMESMVPNWITGADNNAFRWDLAGGTVLSFGTYSFLIMRRVFAAEPTECISCNPDTFGDSAHDDRIDYAFRASFRFPNGGTAEARATMMGPSLWRPSHARVTHREVVVPDAALPAGQEKVRTRTVTLHGFLNAVFWHRVDVQDAYVVRGTADRQPVKTWVESKSHKAYSFAEAGLDAAGGKTGEVWWMSYRWQLEEFVNRVKGRKTRAWITAEDSIKQAEMIDMTYEKAGLGPRETSSFVPIPSKAA